MKTVPTNSPTSVAAVDERDLNSGAHHRYVVQYGGPNDVLTVQFQHGPRGLPDSKPGVYADDLLAIVEDALTGFQEGPFACSENKEALDAVRSARDWLGVRVARRLAQGVLGVNEKHTSGAATTTEKWSCTASGVAASGSRVTCVFKDGHDGRHSWERSGDVADAWKAIPRCPATAFSGQYRSQCVLVEGHVKDHQFPPRCQSMVFDDAQCDKEAGHEGAHESVGTRWSDVKNADALREQKKRP